MERSGRSRSGSGAESGCYRNRLERGACSGTEKECVKIEVPHPHLIILLVQHYADLLAIAEVLFNNN